MGADQCFDRLRGEKANPQADVWWGGPAFRFAQAAGEGLLLPHEPSWAAAAPQGTHDRAWRWAGQFSMPQVIAFHKDLVKDPPKDWDDLAAPAWKGRVVLRDPSASGGMKAAFGAIFARGFAKDGTDAAGVAWVRGLAANRHSIAPNPAKLFDTVRRDTTGVVTIWNLTDVLYQSEVAEPRVPFGWICPASGAPMFPDGIALVARGERGPNPAAADFYEFATGGPVSTQLAEKHRRFLVRTDLARPSWAAGIQVTPMDVDWDLVAAHIDRWQKLWEDELAR
jgi:iron(III) transport system substrate-binding protein